MSKRKRTWTELNGMKQEHVCHITRGARSQFRLHQTSSVDRWPQRKSEATDPIIKTRFKEHINHVFFHLLQLSRFPLKLTGQNFRKLNGTRIIEEQSL